MKTAILVTGHYRKNVRDAKGLIKNIMEIFKVPIFFHTWDNDVISVPIEWHDRLLSCPEPKLDYHPIDDNTLSMKHGKWEAYKTKKLLHNKTANASKQLLAYADLIDKIPDEFDMCIKVRWDIHVSNKVDFTPYLKKAYNDGAVGFMTRGGRKHAVDNLVPLTEKAMEDKFDDWYGYLPDTMIFHKREQFNSKLVKELHANKALAPAEWGWYQILSEPFGDIHTSIHGGALISR